MCSNLTTNKELTSFCLACHDVFTLRSSWRWAWRVARCWVRAWQARLLWANRVGRLGGGTVCERAVTSHMRCCGLHAHESKKTWLPCRPGPLPGH